MTAPTTAVLVPPKVPAKATTVTVDVSLVTTFPPESCTATVTVPSEPPLATGEVGFVPITNLVAVPTVMVMVPDWTVAVPEVKVILGAADVRPEIPRFENDATPELLSATVSVLAAVKVAPEIDATTLPLVTRLAAESFAVTLNVPMVAPLATESDPGGVRVRLLTAPNPKVNVDDKTEVKPVSAN